MIWTMFRFPGMFSMSSRHHSRSAMVCFPSSISRESWLTAATRFRWAPLTGMCCTLAKNSSLWFPMVEKIPLLRTNEFADWIP